MSAVILLSDEPFIWICVHTLSLFHTCAAGYMLYKFPLLLHVLWTRIFICDSFEVSCLHTFLFCSLLTQRLQNLIPLIAGLCIICLLLENAGLCWSVLYILHCLIRYGIFFSFLFVLILFPNTGSQLCFRFFSPFIQNKTGLLFPIDWAKHLSCIFWAFWYNRVGTAVWLVVDAGIKSYKHTQGSLYNQLEKSKSTPLWIGWIRMWKCLAQSEFAQFHN